MTTHRFYVEEIHDKSGKLELDKDIWVHDSKLLNRWLKVLRLSVDEQIVLFNNQTERLYQIQKIEFPHSVHLVMVTEQKRTLPATHVYLLWSLLKNDKNDWVLQKATELGVRNFVPIISERSQKTDINIDRSKKIIIEASEQCGRSDIPDIREPILLSEAISEYKSTPLLVCEKGDDGLAEVNYEKVALLVGPEGGWSDKEKLLFAQSSLATISIAKFTLRAETAAIIAAAKLLQ
jgi:16S rRNA (uracil1498-N3)-methyltransferase